MCPGRTKHAAAQLGNSRRGDGKTRGCQGNWFQEREAAVEIGIPASPSHIPRNLDLMFCPTIIWYETGYSTFTLRQASRRSWRIGQTKPVTVRFLCYENTAQVGCLRLMGRKLLVSMALEGKFSESGLQSMDDGADVLTTLARELVMNQGVGQSADDIWKALQAQQPQTQMAAIATEPEPLPAAPLVSEPRPASTLMFGRDLLPAPARRKVAAESSSEQLSLF